MVLTLPAACAPPETTPSACSRLIRADVRTSRRRRRSDPGAAILRLRTARRHGPGHVLPVRLEPPGSHRRRRRGHGHPRVRGARARRGAWLQAEVGGYGLTCDAYHHLSGTLDAVGASRRCVRPSSVRASAGDVDFVNAHGTGTRANDVAEAKVMREIFGDRRVPISSMKGMLGHRMGAASALEAVACVMSIETGIYPPTLGFETPDPECDVDVVAGTARRGAANVVLNNSSPSAGTTPSRVSRNPASFRPAPTREAWKAAS
ncbi:MAG: hypothetical protein U0169_24620 [Polyangiaceae bacterium]